MSVVGSEAGMDARRVDADSSGARDGVARLSVRPLRGVELRLSEERVSVARACQLSSMRYRRVTGRIASVQAEASEATGAGALALNRT